MANLFFSIYLFHLQYGYNVQQTKTKHDTLRSQSISLSAICNLLFSAYYISQLSPPTKGGTALKVKNLLRFV